jgi:hypothetical protein
VLAKVSVWGDLKPIPPPTLQDIRKVRTHYRLAFGRNLNLLRPKYFSEKIQWRKLFDLNPLYSVLVDKIAVRDFITSRVGAEYVVPLLWSGDSPEDIPFDQLKPPYILKCNHGSGFNIIVNDEASLDREKTRETLRKYLNRGYGWFFREPAYFLIRPRLLAEPLMLEPDGKPPRERKIHVFDGYARVIWTIFVDATRARFHAFHTRDWEPLPWRYVNWPVYDGPDPRPERLEKLLELAETLGAGFDHVRVDFYEWNKRLLVGELTLYLIGSYDIRSTAPSLPHFLAYSNRDED